MQRVFLTMRVWNDKNCYNDYIDFRNGRWSWNTVLRGRLKTN